MAWYRCTGGNSGVGQLTVEKIEKSDWDILLNKDSNTLYLVTADNRPDLILYQYLGNTRLSMYRQDLSAYEFWYENITITGTIDGVPSQYHDFYIDTDVVVGGTNYSRPWQIEMNLGERSRSEGESSIISFNEGSTVELYKNNYGEIKLQIYNGFFGSNGDVIVPSDVSFPNKDIVIRQENGTVTVTVNGTQQYTTDSYYDMGTKKIRLFLRGNGDYPWKGFINYIGFKWLD